MANKRTSIALLVLAVFALGVSAIPSFAAPASQHYQVSTDKNHISAGGSLRVIATIKQADPSCAYTALLTVNGPGGVTATDTVTVNTEAGGNGHNSAAFAADFAGIANTNTAGTYSVEATFTCGYFTGTASSTFTVSS